MFKLLILFDKLMLIHDDYAYKWSFLIKNRKSTIFFSFLKKSTMNSDFMEFFLKIIASKINTLLWLENLDN